MFLTHMPSKIRGIFIKTCISVVASPGGNFFIYTKFEIVIFQSATPKSRTAPRQDFFAHFFYAFQHADNIQTPAKQEKNTPSTSDILKIERDMKNSLKFKKPTQAKTQFPFSET